MGRGENEVERSGGREVVAGMGWAGRRVRGREYREEGRDGGEGKGEAEPVREGKTRGGGRGDTPEEEEGQEGECKGPASEAIVGAKLTSIQKVGHRVIRWSIARRRPLSSLHLSSFPRPAQLHSFDAP